MEKRYMQAEPNASGAYPGIQILNFKPSGFIQLSDDCDDTAMMTHNGYVYKTIENDIVTAITGDDAAYQAWKNQETEKQEKINKQNEINSFKIKLSETDYKIIKCSEASLVGENMPYDITTLHTERQQLRDKINQLETELGESN